MKLDKGNGTNDAIIGLGNITCGGTLVLTNQSGTLANGDSFKLFSATTSSGAYTAITPAIPGSGFSWKFNTTNGALSVVSSVSLNQTNLNSSLSVTNLTLSWPVDHTGWTLTMQTNKLNTGLSLNPNDWMRLTGTAATNYFTIPFDIAQPTELFIPELFTPHTFNFKSHHQLTTGTLHMTNTRTLFSLGNRIVGRRWPVVACAAIWLAGALASAATVTNLTVNNVSNPLGIDLEVPLRFGWQMNSGQRSDVQTAYQVLVSATSADATNAVGSVWDSGKVMSSDQTSISYGGALSARTRYYVRVKLWDKDGVGSPWSDISTFETALLTPSDWTAQWLGDVNANLHYLRKEFQVNSGKTIDHARAYVGGAGTYVLRINGQKVSPNEYFLPMQTYFDTVKSRVLYRTFDITSLLTAGTNAVGIILQSGFLYSSTERAICEMDVYYTDGTRDTVLSDNNWKALYNGGPYILTTTNGGEFYCAGETYDARQELTGWDKGGYNDLSWVTAPNPWVAGTQNGILSPQCYNEFICNWAGGTDYSLSAQFQLQSGGVELIFRSDSTCQNFYMWQLATDGTLRPHKCVAGAYSVLKQVNIGALDQNWHNITITCAGNTITTFIDGVAKDITVDSTFTSGTVGIRGYCTDAINFDSMTVTAVGGSPVLFSDNFDNLNNWPFLKKQPRLVAQVSGTIAYTNIVPVLINTSGTTKRYDIGANVSGFVEVTATGASGDVVTITAAESLNSDGTLNRNSYDGGFYARSIDTYTLKGGATESYKPEFTAHGFRYFEITAPATTTISSVVVRALGNSMPLAAQFTSSTKVLNDLYQGYVWGQHDNSISFPTSCNNRSERHPYVLDAQVSERSAMLYFGAQGLYEKWLNDFLDGESPNGFMGYIVPPYRGGNDPIWSAGTATLPWDHFAAYTDKAVLANYYPRAQRYVACLNAWAPTGIMYSTPDHTSMWTDWGAVNWNVNMSPTEFFLTLYYYRCVDAVKNMASALGKTADVAAYNQNLTTISNAFNALYLHTDHYDAGQQVSDAMPLHFGLVPAASRAAVAGYLANSVITNGMHLTVGALGGDSLLSALAENGYENVAYALATQTTYPSWGYMVESGPGTYWEFWGGGSLNHPMMSGGVARYVINCVGGIDKLAPGYKQIRIKPYTGGVETYASTRLATVRGDIGLNWTNTGSAINMDVLIPPNTTAQVYVPTTSTNAITESGVLAANSPGVAFSAFSNGCAIYNVGSGHYLFSSVKLSGNHYTAVASGNFNTPTIWSPNGTPGRNDSITIGSGVTVTLTNTVEVASLWVSSSTATLIVTNGLGNGRLTVWGVTTNNGTMNLYTTNTFAGGIQHLAGAINLYHPNALLNSGTITVAGTGAAIELYPGDGNTVTYANVPVNLSGSGINSGNDMGALRLSANNAMVTWPGAVTINSPNTYIGSYGVSDTITLPGGISGMGGLLFWAGGGSGGQLLTVILTGANTYTGDTTISAGTLALGGAGTLGGGNYGGQINLNGALVYGSSAAQTLAGPINGAGPITQNGPGKLTLTGTLNNWPTTLYNGNVTVNNGSTLIMPDLPWTLNGIALTVKNGGALTTGVNPSEIQNWTLNGGVVNSLPGTPGQWGNLLLIQNSTLTAGSAAVSTIASQVDLHGTNGFFVDVGSTLNLTGYVVDGPYGPAGLTKTGVGTLVLATNTYTGGTTVSAGELEFSTIGSCASTVSVAAGATNGVLVASAGGQWVSTGNLTNLNSSAIHIDFGTNSPSPAVPPVKVANLLLGTGLTLKLTDIINHFVSGQAYPLITWTGNGPSDATAFTSVILPPRVSGRLSVTGKTIYLTPTISTNLLSWNIGNGNWDTSTANWVDATNLPAIYADGVDVVKFDDASGTAGNPTVTLGSTLAPTMVTMSSTSHNYTLSGAGGIGGSASLTLASTNTQTLTLATVNTYSGDTTISAGTLALGGAGTLGGGNYGGTINLNGALVYGSSAAQTLSGVFNGAGSLTQNGPGKLTLTGTLNNWPTSYYTGHVTVNSATLQMPDIAWTLNGIALTVNAGATVTTGINPSEIQNWTLNGGTVNSTGDTAPSPGNFGNLLLAVGSTVTAGGGAVSTIASDVALSGPNVFAVDAGSTLNLTGLVFYGPDWHATIATSGITKTGAGTLTLSGANTYTGVTTISNGVLQVNGSLAGGGAVNVVAGTLGGNGVIVGPTTIQAAGNLAIGQSIGRLTISNNLFLAGSTTLKLDKGNGTNDAIIGLGNITYGGALVLTNLTGTLANGDSFKLFSATTSAGAFAAIIPATPGSGLVWNFNPANGVLAVVSSVNTNSTNLTFTVASGVLKLSWPADHTGWRLLVQTNHQTKGISVNLNDWMTVPGSGVTNQVLLPIDPAQPTGFYRLVYP